MKTLLFLIISLILSCICNNMHAQSDTNFIYHDWFPDVYIYASDAPLYYPPPFQIDVNQDGFFDIEFKFQQMSAGGPTPFIKCLNGNTYFGYFSIEAGDSITNTSHHWRNNFITSDNQWLGDRDKTRIAIKIKNGENNYFGWIKVEYKIETPIKVSYTFDKYALCKIPNYPIVFGQIGITTFIDIPEKTEADIIIDENSNVIVTSLKEIKSLTIINIYGASVLLKDNIHSKEAIINISSIAKGAYFVRVRYFDDSLYVGKIVNP